MEPKLLICLLGFKVCLQDRRNGEYSDEFIVVPCLGAMPDDLDEVRGKITKQAHELGFDVNDISYEDAKVLGIDCIEAYKSEPTISTYEETEGEKEHEE